MTTVCDLADDLRDTIIEYQVSTDTEKHTRNGMFILFIGRAAEGDLQAELQIDCELLFRASRELRVFNLASKDAGQT